MAPWPFAAYAREVAKQYDVNIALHTDHCPKDKLEGFVLPLLAESEKAVARGEDPIFNSTCGTAPQSTWTRT